MSAKLDSTAGESCFSACPVTLSSEEMSDHTESKSGALAVWWVVAWWLIVVS